MARNVAVRFTADMSDVDKGVQQTEKKLGKLGESLGKIAAVGGVAIGGALVAGLMESLNLEKAQGKLAAQLGNSTVSAAEAGKAAGAVYRNGWGESIDQVNEAIVKSSRDIGATSQAELQGIAQKALIVSSTFDQDLGGVTKAVGQMMKTGLAKNADEAFDIITGGIQSGVDKSGDFLDTLNEYGTQFRKVGLDGAAMTGILSQGLKGGARDADLVADSIKEFSIRAVDGSKTTADGFKSLGLSGSKMQADIAAGGPKAAGALDQVFDKLRAVKDPAEQSRIAVELFGTQAEDLGAALFAIDPSEATKGMGDLAGATDKAANAQNGAMAQFESFKRTMIGLATDAITGYVIPAFMSVVTWVQNNGQAIMWIAGIIGAIYFPLLVSMAVQATISAAKQVAAWAMSSFAALTSAATYAFAFAAVVAGWVWAGIQSLIQAGRMALAWFIAMGPVGWVIATVIALAALIIANWDWIKNKTIEIWTIVWNWIKDKWNWIYDNVIKPVGDKIRGVFDGIGGALDGLRAWFGRVVDAIGKKWNEIKEIAAAPARFLIEWVWNKGIREAWNAVVGLFGGKQLDPVKLAFAGGGSVFGAGTGTSDSVLARLSTGEHVWTADEVRKAGGHDQVYAMREAVKHGTIGQYRAGGPVGPPVAGGGIIWQTLWNIISHQFPGARLTSSVRNEPGSYHNVGKAIDIAGARSMDMPFMLMVDRWIAQNYPNATELIHTDAGAINLWHGAPHTYNAQTQADHRNHVHWAMESLTGNLPGGVVGQGVRDFVGQVTDFFKNPFGLVDKLKGQFGGTGWGRGLGDAAKFTVDKLFGAGKDLASSANAAVSVPTAGGGAGTARWRPLILQALAMMGQPASLLSTVERRMNQESGGNPNIINNWDSNAKRGTPSQGLMQVIPPTFAANRDPRAPNNILDPLANLLASMHYAMGRYGSLSAAYNRSGGYALGGMVPGIRGSSQVIMAHGGEVVIPSHAVDGLGGGMGVVVKNYNLTIVDAANGRVDLEQQFRRMEILDGVA